MCDINETLFEVKGTTASTKTSKPSSAAKSSEPAGNLSGKYACVYEAMDIEFSLQLSAAGQYIQDTEFVGVEKGSYVLKNNTLSFTPSGLTRNGKEKAAPAAYQRSVVLASKEKLVMTNLGDSDQFVCSK